jgi:hypothetical protein
MSLGVWAQANGAFAEEACHAVDIRLNSLDIET